jgi:hypothetical protein
MMARCTISFQRITSALFFVAGSNNILFLGAKIMKKITILLLFLSMTSPMLGAVSTRVCEADGNTPFNGRDIMVGTKLTIITSSDTGGYWGMGGGLFIKEEYWDYGILSARDYNDTTLDWEGSRYPAAGDDARVWDWAEPDLGLGFMFEGDSEAIAGDWFIIDYNALGVGNCTIDFYDFDVDEFEPVDSFTFHQVRTRDFNNDTKVDFRDFAVFASYWQVTDCNNSAGCQGTDLDVNGSVDVNDLMLFCEYWLERTE